MTDPLDIPPLPPAFAEKIAGWPDAAAQRFDEIRTLILWVASASDCGPIAESMKWSQPAWRPVKLRQGSTLRAVWSAKMPAQLSLFVDCKTSLAQTMQHLYPSDFKYENNRSLSFYLDAPLPSQAIRHLADLTFHYHLSPR